MRTWVLITGVMALSVLILLAHEWWEWRKMLHDPVVREIYEREKRRT